MKFHQTCDGVSRRDLLKIGSLSIGGLTMAGYDRLAAAGQVKSGFADRAIFIELPGGPSHLDTFDPKPNAPDTHRGAFKPISTNVPGIQICEHLPKIAGCMDKIALLRGVSHTLAAHRLGQEYVNTGSKPTPALEYPSYGSVLAKEQPADPDIPSAVAIPKAGHGSGFLGIRYSSLETNSQPNFGRPYGVRGISLPGDLAVDEVQRRQTLLRKLDRKFAELEKNDQLLEGLDQFGEQAYSMITSERARNAFDISNEPQSFAKQFGEDSFGQSCMLALRLVESGVRFVTVQLGGWDTHADNFSRLKDGQLPKLDAGLSGLLNGLEQRGLLQQTAVFVTGEFGRTPKINTRSSEGGRDHYPRCMFMLMAGGGVRGGQVIGESDDTASGPRHEAITPDDVAASFYHNLGVDPTLEFNSTTGRPITLVRDGSIVQQLFS
ncbi:DUF1501 domain-containing protein [Rhodopirellula sp. MGV]|uniref:DUF1501 domain-containing protein n=1 Tax=Rhodopirellula sp. MGV TaxID=2023130 RepID=UPI000B96C855|nr:DUF1501 domain-containing protein [Rhodopirellula sp. MGV]OYP31026.1 hypothetical protein CGZ80_21880 [Rhodopirellula sp. MGV]PNY34742.1 DUF1501 domain-containing protein [Rhodopirellula baltica]